MENTDTKIVKFKAGNVVFNTVKNKKVVLGRDYEDAQGLYKFVCESAHADGDFSYLCGSDYCRCSS